MTNKQAYKDDEQLLRNFLHSHREEIADRGFSRRVARRLASQPESAYPRTALWCSNLLTVLSGIACIFLFLRFDGFERIWRTLEYSLTLHANEWICNGSLPALFGTFLLLVIIGVGRVCNSNN